MRLIHAVRNDPGYDVSIALDALSELDAIRVELARLRRIERNTLRFQGMTDLA